MLLTVSVHLTVLSSLASLLPQVTTASASETAGTGTTCKATGWGFQNFKSLVTFGDSYTDESRLGYFIKHNGSAPPVGWVDPVNNNTASGGYTWPRYVADYTGANLYDYAVSGAVCSNLITPRYFSAIHAPFPSILEYEIPAYIADSKYTPANSGTPFLDIPPSSTIYSIWIGTNDLGNGAFLTDSQVPGTNLTTYLDCVYTALDQVYANGGRYFVLMNLAPLQLAPLYALPPPKGAGVGANQYWPQKDQYNLTEVSFRMMEMVNSANDVYRYRTPVEWVIRKRYPGAKVAVMDMYGLLLHIYNNPTQYYNGSAPANVTGYINHCNINQTVCARRPSPDSYMWFDELHPSQRTDQIIGQNFVDVVKGESRWATYWE